MCTMHHCIQAVYFACVFASINSRNVLILITKLLLSAHPANCRHISYNYSS